MITIHGGGIAGCTAARLLGLAKVKCALVEWTHKLGGMAFDGDGFQAYGPHVLHTDDEEVWKFCNAIMPFMHVTLRVSAMVPDGLIELPRLGDPVFDVYGKKAWGSNHQARDRVKPRLPNQVGYVLDRHQGIPQFGFSVWCERCVPWMETHTNRAERPRRGDIWTGPLDELPHGLGELPWRGRQFVTTPGRLPAMVINYCRWDVPQLRSWDNVNLSINYREMVGTEFAGPGKHYPMQEGQEQAAEMRKWADAEGIILIGRGASYEYMDMDHVIRQAMETLKNEGLI